MEKYRYVYSQLKDQIIHGNLQQGEKLPSIRSLCTEYGFNKDTIIKALTELRMDGYIYAVPKSGYYVLKQEEQNYESVEEKSRTLKDFQACMEKVVSNHWIQFISMKNVDRGDSHLIQSVFQLLKDYGVYTTSNQILVTSGAQQALYILLTLLQKEGGAILLEEPTYPQMRNMVEKLNIPYFTIERTIEGIDLIKLEQLFKAYPIHYFYMIPRVHYPLGCSLSEKDKENIVALAQQYQVKIIEDDYMADYELGLSNPMHYYDTTKQVVYLKSFSSLLFSSLRIAIIVLPEEVFEQFLEIKKMMDYDNNLMLQQAFALYIDSGLYEKHRLRKLSSFRQRTVDIKNKLTYFPNLDVYQFYTTLLFPLEKKLAAYVIKQYSSEGMEYIDSLEPSKIGFLRVDTKKVTNELLNELIEYLNQR